MNPDDIQKERDESRYLMVEAWQKHLNNEQLEPLEHQIVSIIEDHPEFHAAFEQKEHLEIDYPMDPTINPFLHIGLHLAILEQISIDQPIGIRDLYQTLTQQVGDVHETEHMMLQVLTGALQAAIQDPSGEAEKIYMANLRRLLE